tara:strand:- start:636 stop:764 length:129 start_codon:yes stop_codon:yes gene_type:complete
MRVDHFVQLKLPLSENEEEKKKELKAMNRYLAITYRKKNKKV